jgi:hypothetical protein
MADFGLLGQMPNFAQAAMSGYQAGQQIGRQKQLDAAMQNIDLDRPETLLPILRADPSTGAALIGASVKLSAAKRDEESRAATAAYIKSVAGSTPSATPTTTAGPTPTAAVGSDGDLAVTSPVPSSQTPGDVVVTAPPQAPADPNAIRNAAIDADPTGFLDIQSKIGAMDEATRKRVAAASDSFASLGQMLLSVPYPQRAGYIQAHAADLIAHGVPADKIRSFDPTDQNIHMEVGQALGIKAQLDQADKDRSFGLDQARFGETVHHNRVDESQGAARIGLEAQSVGIAGGHLALARNADARAAAAAGAASGGVGAALPAPTSRAQFNALPKGTRFRAPDGSVRIK